MSGHAYGHGYDPRPAYPDNESPLAGLWAGADELPLASGDLTRSLTYRQTYTPTLPAGSSDSPRRRLTAAAPDVLTSAAGGAWALVSMTAAGGVLVLVVLVVVRLVGWLT